MSALIEHRCMLLSGPADGSIVWAGEDQQVYFVAEKAAIRFDREGCDYTAHRYHRTTTRTFLHESESVR